MPAVDIEGIWEALAARLQSTSGFTKVTRRRKDWAPEELPVLMVLDDSGDEDLVTDPSDPAPAWRITGELVIIAKTQPLDTDEKPTAKLNDLVKDVRSALERAPTDPIDQRSLGRGHLQFYTDLGGRVRNLAITKVEKGAGEKTGQSVAKLFIEMDTNA